MTFHGIPIEYIGAVLAIGAVIALFCATVINPRR